MRVNSDTDWLVKFSLPFFLLPKLSQVFTSHCEHLNSVVVTIGDIHLAFTISGYVARMVELSIVTAFTTKTTGVCEVRVQNLNSAVAIFSNIHFVCVRMYCNACWAKKL